MLGPQLSVLYVNGSTALKLTGRQPVHTDLNFTRLQFPSGIVANYYLMETDKQKFDRGVGQITQANFDRRPC